MLVEVFLDIKDKVENVYSEINKELGTEE